MGDARLFNPENPKDMEELAKIGLSILRDKAAPKQEDNRHIIDYNTRTMTKLYWGKTMQVGRQDNFNAQERNFEDTACAMDLANGGGTEILESGENVQEKITKKLGYQPIRVHEDGTVMRGLCGGDPQNDAFIKSPKVALGVRFDGYWPTQEGAVNNIIQRRQLLDMCDEVRDCETKENAAVSKKLSAAFGKESGLYRYHLSTYSNLARMDM